MLSEWEKQQQRYNGVIVRFTVISTVASVVGIFIGALGTFLGWYAINQAANLEEIKMRPNIEVQFLGGKEPDQPKEYFFKLMNTGAGPAKIKSIIISRGENSFDLTKIEDFKKDEYYSNVGSIFDLNNMKKSGQGSMYSIAWLSESSQLMPGEKWSILHVWSKSSNESEPVINFREHMKGFLKSGKFVVNYCSVTERYCSSAKATVAY